MLQNRRLLCIALASTVMLSACGFKLRGSILGANLPFKSLYISIPESSSLGAELRRNIRGGGEVTLVSTPEEADATLNITSESRSRQILSLNSQGRVREYVLNYRATISVRDNKNVELLPPTQLALKRDISYNEEFVLAKEAEEALLYRDMQSDLVQQILRRLSAINPVAKAEGDVTPASSSPTDVPDAGGAMPAPAGGAANK
jgi:LPS-assembly lipoprotein